MHVRGSRLGEPSLRWPRVTTRSRPAVPYVVLSGLLLVISGWSALFSLLPTTSDLHLYVVLAAFFFLAMAIWVWFAAPRLPNGWGLDTALVVTAVVAVSASALAQRPENQVVLGLSLLVFGTYAAYFRPTARFALALGAMLLAYGVIVLATGVMHPLYYVVVASLTVVVTGTIAVLVAQMRHQTMTDDLTGVLNRRGLTAMGGYVHAEMVRTGMPVAVALIDVDRFKDYNDRYGHLAGDELLVSIATGLRDELRATDIVARFGGDEFALILPGTDSQRAAEVVARVDHGRPGASWSAGIADWPVGQSLSEALARADQRLYAVKQGR